ncbi:hypothetical protein C5B85_13150 [Pseudoclavibacter sp. AY1F1]|uniref:DUF2264 domain-containing protein n=1 Tax=Pseudoclavibacter sp. AY1F1 TaxID=2080583 RepID=UPI000CE83A21|nr:DUF2264 domain-containing protein [Pseudoclavibacter sp. AY1F1]PPF43636.1 hypothetical protein C5B85_13150 [Pseudoclavibacter sp. AY1F1]
MSPALTPEAPATAAQSASQRAWTRDDWTSYADRLLTGAMAWASPGNGRITPPGAEGGYGHDIDGLEGFARTFLLAGFRIAGERGQGVDELISFFSQGIRTGVDPDAADRWVRLEEHPQAKVEAASLALILDLTRPWIWDALDELTQQRVIDYFAPAVGDDTYPRTNWLWFRLVVQTFLRSVGGPWSPEDVTADLALHDSFVRADGWLSDGDERSYDHYVGWALHIYPVLWSRMRGAAELAGDRLPGDVAALDRFLQDAVHLIGGDGSPLLQGRSLIYRFAAAAPFWVGALAEVPSVSLGALRHAAEKVVSHFAERGVPDERGLLTMGWLDEWRQLAQAYSGPASPYWASKGLLGILLPADHPVWAAEAEPLPVEQGDFVRTIAAPGWVVTGTKNDGIVRIANHGTDHAKPYTLVGDSPLYARIAYSSATSPLLDDAAWHEPLEQSVALIDGTGTATHRAAMDLLATTTDGDAGVAASTWLAHTLVPNATQQRHGSGLDGEATVVARLTVVSAVRGPEEVRLARVTDLAEGVDKSDWMLRWGGWPVTSRQDAQITSALRGLTVGTTARTVTRTDASPLGASTAVPVLDAPVEVGTWAAAHLTLAGADHTPSITTGVEFTDELAAITWSDGARSTVDLTNYRLS